MRILFEIDSGSENYSEMRLVMEAGGKPVERDMALPMDALSTPLSPGPAVARPRPGEAAPAADALACVPPEAPLAMPVQSLTKFNRAGRYKNSARPPVLGLLAGAAFCVRRRPLPDRLWRLRDVQSGRGRRRHLARMGASVSFRRQFFLDRARLARAPSPVLSGCFCFRQSRPRRPLHCASARRSSCRSTMRRRRASSARSKP